MKPTCVCAWTEEIADGEYEHCYSLCGDDGEPVEDAIVEVCATAEVAEHFAMRLAARFGGLKVITDDLKQG